MGGPRFVAGVFAVFIFIFAMSEVGTIGKRLSNKIDNDVAVARTAPACFTMKWTNLVFHHSIIEVDGFPWRFECHAGPAWGVCRAAPGPREGVRRARRKDAME